MLLNDEAVGMIDGVVAQSGATLTSFVGYSTDERDSKPFIPLVVIAKLFHAYKEHLQGALTSICAGTGNKIKKLG